MDRRQGIVSSVYLFLFWLMMLITGIIGFRTYIRFYINKVKKSISIFTFDKTIHIKQRFFFLISNDVNIQKILFLIFYFKSKITPINYPIGHAKRYEKKAPVVPHDSSTPIKLEFNPKIILKLEFKTFSRILNCHVKRSIIKIMTIEQLSKLLT